MDLLDRLLGHDSWTTRQLLVLSRALNDDQLDRPFDIGRGSLRATFVHIIRNMEIWAALMDGRVSASSDVAHETSEMQTVEALIERLDVAAGALARVARDVRDRGAWDETWLNRLGDPPRLRSFGGTIAHVITHSMHHRGQVLFMLRRLGVDGVPEGDVLSWEHEAE